MNLLPLRRAVQALPALLLLATPSPAQVDRECHVFVTEEATGKVHSFHGVSVAPQGVFGTAPGYAMAIHTGGPGQHALVGTRGGGVHELDRNTGLLVRTYNPGGGWQWAGIYAANGDVLIGDMSTNDVRRYDPTNGNYLGVFGLVPGPADMVFGPNGNLFVCSFTAGGVFELNGVNGAFVAWHAQAVGVANDILFMPDGRRVVTSMATNQAHVFNAAWVQVATFAGTGWGRPHGIDRSPHDGHIYVVDGATSAVHRFHQATYVELNATWIFIPSKPVDVEFRHPPQPCGSVVSYGSGCNGLWLDHTGVPNIGTNLTLLLHGAVPVSQALLGIGVSRTDWNGIPLPLPLDQFGARGCSVSIGVLDATASAIDVNGDSAQSLALPRDRNLIGKRFYLQWFALDPRNALGVSSSDAAEVRIGG